MNWLGVVVLLAAGLVACGKKEGPKAPPAREVEVLRLQPAEVRDTGEYLATLSSRQSVSILPQVSGYVRKIHVRPGQKVQAGAPLLELDARQETAALDSAQAQSRSAAANLELARQTRARTEALYKEGLASAQELERARSAAQAAEASAGSASATVSERQVQVQYNVLKAPFAGVVGDVLVRLGDYATAQTVATSIAQADVLEASIAVPAERARAIRVDTPVELLDDRGEVLVRSGVYFVAPLADPRTQLVDVKAVFSNTLGLRPSELIRARIVYGARQALQVPALAVVRLSGQAFVFAVQEKDGKTTVARRPVRLGALGERAYVVEGGLQAGDRIAVSSLQSLRDGALIQPRPAKPQASGVEASLVKDSGGSGPGPGRN
ncbi:MAG TPA: efflux RND transporter periplasmic adaptor subunit [Aggregicoccus sp.]|nr:efflux RND transporter periplasmic adaptor subunit [Aggregicoccus sp.]